MTGEAGRTRGGNKEGTVPLAAVLSDIHSNLEALRAVLPRVEGLRLYSLGDAVGYGASPNEVVNELRARGAVSVMGNHDYAAVTGDTRGFNARAAMAAKWTARALEGANADYLGGLPKLSQVVEGGTKGAIAHGSPDDPLWEYVTPQTHSLLFDHYLERLHVGFVGLGHTHVPFVSYEGRGVVFNPGSVGQPRDGDWRASYSVLSLADGHLKVENFRAEYDVGASASKVRKAGLPESLADRLLRGI